MLFLALVDQTGNGAVTPPVPMVTKVVSLTAAELNAMTKPRVRAANNDAFLFILILPPV